MLGSLLSRLPPSSLSCLIQSVSFSVREVTARNSPTRQNDSMEMIPMMPPPQTPDALKSVVVSNDTDTDVDEEMSSSRMQTTSFFNPSYEQTTYNDKFRRTSLGCYSKVLEFLPCTTRGFKANS